MKTFRQILFWLHLVAGLLAGMVIFIMCVTGALLALERQTIEWAERDSRYVSVSSAPELEVAEILANVIEARPDAKPTSIAIKNEDGAAWEISLGREGVLFADPYTGAITGESNKNVRDVMSKLREWHRFVALSGDQRSAGKAITGAGNLLFLFLAISGIYIWFPRNFVWKAVQPVIWFRRGQRGKARNFNWHNTIGFWTSFFLIIFTLTATVISYQWASNLLYTFTGNEVPAPQGGGPQQQQPPRDEVFTIPQNINAVWVRAVQQSPSWKSISLRLPANESSVFTIDEGVYWNIFGRSTLTIDTADAQVRKWDPYGERNGAVQLRSWFRFTHTGETGGIVGQLIGLIACVGGAFLVWTGFSLAFRRFGNWLKRRRNVAEAV
ncbi:MAG: PepSY-associated TM helix domain-containing protein [Pyrinomonadaceae bacterium]